MVTRGRNLLALAVGMVATTAFAAVDMGEELILNGKMNADQMDLPPYWMPDASTNCKFGLSSGPNGMPALVLLPGISKENAVRQNGMNLSSNGIYVLSFMYKATDAEFDSCSIGIAASGWKFYSGMDLPRQTDGWQKFSSTVVAQYSPEDENRHFLVFYTVRQRGGTVAFADVSLKPADETTAAGTDFSDGAKSQREIRLVPIAPRLDEIPPKRRTIAFRFFGTLPDDASMDNYVATFEIDGFEQVVLPLSREILKVRLPDTVRGGRLTAEVRPRIGGSPLFSRTYEYGVLPDLKSSAEGRRLNNLCMELVGTEVKSGRREFSFAVKRRAWHFFSVPGTATLNGQPLVSADTPRHEAFRELVPGDYELTVDASASGVVTVRRIAEIYNYCPCTPPAVSENPPYDWEFQKRHVLGGVTTQCGGRPTRQELCEMIRLGYKHIVNQNARHLKNEGDMLSRLRKSVGMTDPLRAGVSADEIFLHESLETACYVKSLWDAGSEFSGKGVYTWMVGTPAAVGLDHDLIAAAVNSCSGRSRILYEMYMPTQPTEERAENYILTRMRSTAAAYSTFLPGVIGRFGFVFGNFNQMPAITLCNHPEVDYKYYLDMQWNALATDPAFSGMGLCGYWGSYYGDEEMHRWSFLLTRHYVVEGRTDMLSGRFGLKFFGLVPNGDFQRGFDGWRVTENVVRSTHPKISGWRGIAWRDGDEGDYFAEMPVKENDRVSKLSCVVRGLMSGRDYVFQCCSFDIDKINRQDMVRETTGVEVDFGADAMPHKALSWHNIGNTTTKYSAKRPGINLTHIVFRANSPEIEMTISNAGTPNGRRIGVNAISVNPYVSKEETESCCRKL